MEGDGTHKNRETEIKTLYGSNKKTNVLDPKLIELLYSIIN